MHNKLGGIIFLVCLYTWQKYLPSVGLIIRLICNILFLKILATLWKVTINLIIGNGLFPFA